MTSLMVLITCFTLADLRGVTGGMWTPPLILNSVLRVSLPSVILYKHLLLLVSKLLVLNYHSILVTVASGGDHPIPSLPKFEKKEVQKDCTRLTSNRPIRCKRELFDSIQC